MLASRSLHWHRTLTRCQAPYLLPAWLVPVRPAAWRRSATPSPALATGFLSSCVLLSSTFSSDSSMARTKMRARKGQGTIAERKARKKPQQQQRTESKQQPQKGQQLEDQQQQQLNQQRRIAFIKQRQDEPAASLTGLAEPPTHSSALLLNFPFNPISAPIPATDTDTIAADGNNAADAADLSLHLIESAVRCVRSRLDIHLTCDDWSAVTVDALQRRLAAIYTHAANANPAIDTAVILPNTTPPNIQLPSDALSLTYLAESHSVLGRTLQHTVTIPPHTAVLLCCDFTSLALSTTELRVNPSKSKKKREEAKAAKGDTPKKKRRSRQEIQAETDKVAARISELVSHTDNVGGIHCPQLLKGEGSPFAERSAVYPPLCVLLKDEAEGEEERHKYLVGPLYHVDWLHPSELTMSGTAALPVMGTEIVSSGGTKSWDRVVLGGTFDHFHVGHKLLLSTAAFVCSQSLLVGVTAAIMLKRKTLTELVELPNTRHEAVRSFMQRIKPHVQLTVIEIDTPEGPTIDMAELQCIVVSEETIKGAQSINDQRTAKQLTPLTIVQLPIFNLPPNPATSALAIDPSLQLDKLSSTAARFALLGRYLGRSNAYPWAHLQSSRLHACYTIGLTGGIAAGKSSIAKVLRRCGARVIDCDALGHECYRVGEPAYSAIVDEWGQMVVGKGGEIDRKVLGPLVFADVNEMNKLNAIVWPAIKQKVEERLAAFTADDVVVLEAAVLMEAGWSEDKALCDEVWVAFIGRDEAIRRVQERNKVDAAEATRRVDAQLSNTQRIQRADVLLCTQWSYEQTKQLCELAWEGLQQRVADRAVSLAGKGVRERWEWVVRRMCRRKPPKKIRATINMIQDEQGIEEEQKEEEQKKEDVEDEEEEEKEKKTPANKRVKREAAHEVNGKEEKRQDDDEKKEPAAPPAAATVAESLIVKWWLMLPHSDELDAMRSLLFTLWDQQRPKLHYPEDLLIAIFFHHSSFAVKQEAGPQAKAEAGATLLESATTSNRAQRSSRVKAERVKAEQQISVQMDDIQPSASETVSAGLVASTHSSALASCKLFGSFASDMCLPAACVDRILGLLTMAAPPAAGVHLPAKPAESVDQEVWTDLVRAMR